MLTLLTTFTAQSDLLARQLARQLAQRMQQHVLTAAGGHEAKSAG